MSIRLITANPDAVMDFCRRHPVDMKDAWRAQTIRGGKGDIRPPTPAADAFFHLYLEENKGLLPTQAEYVAYCRNLWATWWQSLDPYVQNCFTARLYRNFYPSFIDSVHVWALLGTRFYAHGQLVFDRCILDTYADVIQKADLMTYRGEECLRIALVSGSYEARKAATFKQTHRPQPASLSDERRVALYLPMEHPKVWGKRWYYWPRDFGPVRSKVEQLWLPGMNT